MNDEKSAFLLEEYKQLRAEIMQLFQRMDTVERNALLSSGAIWAWLATNEQTALYQFVVWAPMLLSTMFSLKAAVFRHGIHKLARYIERLEVAYELPKDLGWEQSSRAETNGSVFHLGFWPTIFFWVGLIGANGLAAALFPEAF